MKRTYVEDVFDNLRNEYGVVGLYIAVAWDSSLQARSKKDVRYETTPAAAIDLLCKEFN